MKTQVVRKAMRSLSAATMLAAVLGLCSVTGMATDKKPPSPPPAPKAPPPRPSSAPHPMSSGGSHTTPTTSSHPMTTTGSHGPTTGTMTHGPTTTGTHGPTTTTTTTRGPITTTGAHGPTTGGATNMNTGGGGTTTHGPTTGTHGPTTGGATNMNTRGGGTTTHGPTTGTHTVTGVSPNATGVHPSAGTSTGLHPGMSPGAGVHPATGIGAGTHGPAASHTVFNRPAPVGSNEHITRTGSAVRMRPNGHVSDIHDVHRGIDVHHNLSGGRRVIVDRPDHTRVFVERGRPGYVQRGYSYHGHDFGRRTYYYHGHEYHRYYRGYGYHGVFLNVYSPGYYYRPAFYGWAYNPWAAPISFGWGWGGNPWYGHFGYYFQPYPVYPSAAFWLTDYLISQDLQAAYAAHQEAGEADGTAPPPAQDASSSQQPVLTPEIKQMIADEVKNQLALENQEAQQNAQQQDPDPGSSGIARLLSDGRPHVFVAGGNLDVMDVNGQECVVSDGDTLQLREAPPSDATSANLVVLSSKGKPECQISLTVQVQLTDLQEMQNHMRETIDQGLKDLQDKQGTGGLPAVPPSAAAPPAEAQYASAAPPPETNVSAELQQQDQQSQQAEKEVTAEPAQDANDPGAASAAPDAGAQPADAAAPEPDVAAAATPPATAAVELGQTIDQVRAALGAPARIANLGPKVVFYYNDKKVTFIDGKVTEVR